MDAVSGCQVLSPRLSRRWYFTICQIARHHLAFSNIYLAKFCSVSSLYFSCVFSFFSFSFFWVQNYDIQYVIFLKIRGLILKVRIHNFLGDNKRGLTSIWGNLLSDMRCKRYAIALHFVDNQAWIFFTLQILMDFEEQSSKRIFEICVILKCF